MHDNELQCYFKSSPPFCLVGIVLVLAVFKAWRDCSLSFTLEFQHRWFHFILGWSSLARCRTVKVSCLLVWCVILQINGQKLNCNLVASTVLYVLTSQLELSLKPAPHINFQLWTKTLLSCRTFSTVYRIISKISLRRKKSNLALSLKWNGTASNSNMTDKSPYGYMVVKQYVSDDLASGSEDNKRLRRATRTAVRVVRTGEKASCATRTTNDSGVFFLALIHNFSGKVDLFNRPSFTLCLFILLGFACNLLVSLCFFLFSRYEEAK